MIGCGKFLFDDTLDEHTFLFASSSFGFHRLDERYFSLSSSSFGFHSLDKCHYTLNFRYTPFYHSPNLCILTVVISFSLFNPNKKNTPQLIV